MGLGIVGVEEWDRSYGVTSLTEKLLSGTFGERRMEGLTEAEWAVRSKNFLEQRIMGMGEGNILYGAGSLLKTLDGPYVVPEIEIGEATAIGVAMAMLILSTMANEVVLDTQIEGLKGAQNQKESASVTKMQQLREQIRKARYKSRFQKFMAWLMDTWLMKFLKSTYGKVIMFLICVALTVVTFGGAAPLLIAYSSIMIGIQAAELIMGKSMGELITQSMPDGAWKMALQMYIDISLMVGSMVTGGGGAKAADVVETAAKAAQTAAKAAETAAKTAQTVAKAADMVGDVATTAGKAVETLQKALQNIQKVQQRVQVALQLVNAMNNFAKSEEQANMLWHTAGMEAIRTEYEGKEAYYQVMIDHMMGDIETLIDYVKASFARAAEVIREQGEVSRMIAGNLVM